MTEPERDYGAQELHTSKDLSVIRAIQRTPADARVREIRAHWSDAKCGILICARISEGKEKGKLHIVDGGTRWLAKNDEPNYVFVCWVRPMTMKEAADEFLAINDESLGVVPFDKFRVGLRADKPEATALKRALDARFLVADPVQSLLPNGDGSAGRFAAFGAARTILWKPHGKEGEWGKGSDLLARCLTLAAAAYPRNPETGPKKAPAFDSDLLYAVHLILLANPEIDLETEERLATTIGLRPVGEWRFDAMELKRVIGGQRMRAMLMRGLIVREHNKAWPKEYQLAGGLDV